MSNVYLFPANVGVLAKLVSKDDHRGFAFTGIRLLGREGGYYTVEATNGRMLGRVTGCTESGDSFPEIAELTASPNGEASAIIPAKELACVCKEVPRGRILRNKPVLGNVAAVFSKDLTTLASTDLQSQSVQGVRNLDGRWPDFNGALPSKEPKFKISFDGRMLTDLLQVAQHFAGEANKLTLAIHGKDGPMVVTSENGPQQFTGAIVPNS
jgi:hypothetical protein